MRAVRIILLTVLTVALVSATAFGASVAVQHFDNEDTAQDATEPGALPSETGDEDPTDLPADPSSESPSPDPSESESAKPKPVLSPGEKGEKVRELQQRLFQTAWLGETTTGTYDAATKAAVKGFQEKRKLPATGIVDKKTWDKLVKMTKTPTHDQKHNVLKPGPKLVGKGDSGDKVRDVQARLKQLQWFFGNVTGTYGDATVAAVKGFQEKRKFPVTGEIDQRTMDRIVSMSRTPTHEELHNIAPKTGTNTNAALDPRCKTGRALCIDKSSQTLRWVINGQVQSTFEVRFGSAELPTREGVFSVQRKSRDHVSSLYHTPMPFAMFFSGGQAVHYSPDFAARGYNGASHGCVNVRDKAGITALFGQVNLGDKVIVYWS